MCHGNGNQWDYTTSQEVLRLRGTASTVKNKISCAYVEIIKHQQTKNRTNSPLPMAGNSLPLNEHPAACVWKWELVGSTPDTGVAGELLWYLEQEMKLLREQMHKSCSGLAEELHHQSTASKGQVWFAQTKALQQLFRQVMAHKGPSLLCCVWAKSPWGCGAAGRRGALKKSVQRKRQIQEL